MGLKVRMSKASNKTHSEIHGQKRKPERVVPYIIYEEPMEFLNNKQIELYFAQHKLMREFLSKKKLIDEFNKYQKTMAGRNKGVMAEWHKKWD